MNSKERVNVALSHNEPDRIPVDYWADPIVTQKLMNRLGVINKEDLLRKLAIDFRFIQGAQYVGPTFKSFDDGSKNDVLGVRRKEIFIDPTNHDKGCYEHVIEHPLANAETIKDIEDYKGWPSIDYYDFTHVEEECDMFREYSVVCGGDRLNRTAQLKPAMYLRGVEQIMLDLVLNEEIVEAIFERLRHHFLIHRQSF